MIEAWQVLDARYELGELLGSGGMAEVRRARDVRLGREVAVKMLRGQVADDPTIVAAFRTEAMSSARLSHPGVVAVYDVGEAQVDGHTRPYLVMEMIEGVPLASLLADGTALTVERSIEIGVDVCGALAHAHERGIIHRDVTPSNLMILPTGAVKVTDFGIARAVRAAGEASTGRDTDVGSGYGSVAYISPEQARRREVDARSDLYSLGCVLMAMLTGSPPFSGTPAVVVAAHLKVTPVAPSTRRPGIDPAIDEVVLRCLAKDPWARPQTAAELRRDLLRILVELDSAAARTAVAGGLASADVDGLDITELPTARVASGLLPPALDTGPIRVLPLPGQAPQPPVPQVADQVVDQVAGGSSPGEPGDRPPRLHPGRLVVVAVAAVVLAFVALLATRTLPVGGGTPNAATIPSTAGLTVDKATAALSAVGLSVAAEPKIESSTDFLRGTVIRTEPGAGESADRGSAVALVISSGPAAVTLPELEGVSLEEALGILETAGLTVGSLDKVDSPQPLDQVLSSTPAFGEVLAEGDQVSLRIASGSNVVPDVTGRSQDAASGLLIAAGFQVDVENLAASQAPGTALEVRPAPGARQPVGTAITLVVAGGAPGADGAGTDVGTSPGRVATGSASTAGPRSP